MRGITKHRKHFSLMQRQDHLQTGQLPMGGYQPQKNLIPGHKWKKMKLKMSTHTHIYARPLQTKLLVGGAWKHNNNKTVEKIVTGA